MPAYNDVKRLIRNKIKFKETEAASYVGRQNKLSRLLPGAKLPKLKPDGEAAGKNKLFILGPGLTLDLISL